MKRLTNSEFLIGTYDLSFSGNIFYVEKDSETREFSPIGYVTAILEGYYLEADKTKDYRKKLSAIANAESHITRFIADWDLKKLGFDFTSVYDDIRVTEKRINSYREADEKHSAFRQGAIVAIVAALIGISPTLISLFQNKPQENTIVLPKIQLLRDTIIVEKIVYLKDTISKSTTIKTAGENKK